MCNMAVGPDKIKNLMIELLELMVQLYVGGPLKSSIQLWFIPNLVLVLVNGDIIPKSYLQNL